jgi:hypothetical protein
VEDAEATQLTLEALFDMYSISTTPCSETTMGKKRKSALRARAEFELAIPWSEIRD